MKTLLALGVALFQCATAFAGGAISLPEIRIQVLDRLGQPVANARLHRVLSYEVRRTCAADPNQECWEPAASGRKADQAAFSIEVATDARGWASLPPMDWNSTSARVRHPVVQIETPDATARIQDLRSGATLPALIFVEGAPVSEKGYAVTLVAK